MDRELASLKRELAHLLEDQQAAVEDLIPQPPSGSCPHSGNRQTKRRYSPPSPTCPEPTDAQANNCNMEGAAATDSDTATDECQPHVWYTWTTGDAACSREGGMSLQQAAVREPPGDACSPPWDTWGHPVQTATPADGAPMVGIPLNWLGLGPRPGDARAGIPQPAAPDPGIYKWWKELDERCPTEVAEEANKQLMRERDADSRARRLRNLPPGSAVEGGLPNQGSADGEAGPGHKGKGAHPGYWDPMVVVRQMEEFVARGTPEPLHMPNMRLPRKNLVDRIACLFHLEWRNVKGTEVTSEDPDVAVKPRKAYFATEHSKPLSESGQMLLEQLLEQWKTGKRFKSADWKPHWKRGPWKGKKDKSWREAGSGADEAAVAQAMQPLKPEWQGGGIRVKQEASDRLEAGMLQPLQEDNKGSQMLVGMGWQQGQGIGAREQGMLEPVMVTQRRRGLGLGSQE